MAGGIDWVRWHHGTVTDQKFPLIAKRSGASVAEVIAVWACLLEAAAKGGASWRFSVGDAERIDALLCIKSGSSLRIASAMAERGMLSGDRVAKTRRYFPAVLLRPSASIWSRIRAAVFERDGYVCVYCSSASGPLEADHVVPVKDGGESTMENVVTACRACNRSKGSRSVVEFMS